MTQASTNLSSAKSDRQAAQAKHALMVVGEWGRLTMSRIAVSTDREYEILVWALDDIAGAPRAKNDDSHANDGSAKRLVKAVVLPSLPRLCRTGLAFAGVLEPGQVLAQVPIHETVDERTDQPYRPGERVVVLANDPCRISDSVERNGV